MKTGADNAPVFLLPYNRSKIIDSVWKIRFIHHDSLTHTGGTVMQPFKNKEELQENLSILWDRIFTTPEILSAVAGAKLVARFRYTDFPLTLYIDIKNDPPRFYFNPPGDDDFDVEMILSSETSHHFWMQELNVPLAIASRKIVAKGSIQKALKLLPALKPAFAMYPGVLRDTGRHDLLLKQGRTKIRKKKYFSFGNRKARYNPSLVPAFPRDCLSACDEKRCLPVRNEVAEKSGLEMLEVMCRIRFFEEHLSEAFRKGEVPTEAIHLSIGQEAVAAGVCCNLRDSDYLNTTHRGHGHIIAKGADLKRMMAEIYGKETGQCRGKGGSMHVTDGEKGILGANGIVGAGYLLAMGAGFSIKKRGSDDISVVIAGDGSVNQGMFHEAMNMISLMHLPVLVVVENNRYGEFTSLERHSAETLIHKRAGAYNIEALRLDGNDLPLVYRETGTIIAKMRHDGKPRLLELMTYRWHGHMEGEPELYRTEEERQVYKQDDPIEKMKGFLLGDGIAVQSIEEVTSRAQKDVDGAVEFARLSKAPDIADLMTCVYSPEREPVFTQGNIPVIPDTAVEKSMAQAINEALAGEMKRDGTVFIWGEDVTLGGYFNVTEGLVDVFGPDRIIDTPISEYAIIGGAVGAAMTGLRPVPEILFSDFLTCCMDPIVNQAAKLRYMTGGQVNIPLTIRTPVGSGIGMAAQHSQSMERFFAGIPGLMVVAPSDPFSAMGLLRACIRSDNPIIFFEHKLLYAATGRVPDSDYILPIGKAFVVREGRDVTIVSHLLGVSVARDAAVILESKGISAEVIDLCTLYPMDTDTIMESLAKTGRLVTIEEGNATGGIGAEVIARAVTTGFGLLRTAPLRIAAPECPIPYARNLENAMMPDPEDAAVKIAAMFRQ
jgi:2-oxoisovalerate dehydrogenase E1 component